MQTSHLYIKKDKPTDKENYRPVSVLLLLAKVFERLIYDKFNEHLERYLNPFYCGFQKAYSSQQLFATWSPSRF